MIGGLAAAAFGAAIVVGWSAGLSGHSPAGPWEAWPRRAAVVSWLLCATGAVLMVVQGARAVAGPDGRTFIAVAGPDGISAAVSVDALAGMFLVIAFGVAVPASLAGAALAADRRRLGAVAGLILLAVQWVITAESLFLFLFGWELLTVAFYLATVHDRELPGTGRAAVISVGFGKLSGAALLLGGLLAAADTGSPLQADLGGAAGATRQIAYTLLVLGFSVKAGLLPVHIWLPRGYAAAPAPVRALMGGAAVNVGFYGLWRTLQVMGAPPAWLIVVVLLLAGASAVIGIAHAAVHADLRYLIAWSSVENAGVISAGYAAAMVGAAANSPQLLAAGLLAATAQVIAHALGKSTLFVSAAAVERAWGSTDLDRIRGVARTMPWAGTGMFVGALTLAGLPLTAGLAGEWLTLEALMQQFRIDDLPLQLAMATAGALVALSIGIAGFTFVRLAGLTAFGRSPGGQQASRAGDRSRWLRAGLGALVLGCLAVAAFAPAEIAFIATGLHPIVQTAAQGALVGGWVLQPVYAGFSALSPTWLWIVIPAMTLLVVACGTALSGARAWRAQTVPAWRSGSPGADRGTEYTSFGYANPVRTVLANLLRTRGRLDGSAADTMRKTGHSVDPNNPEAQPLPQYTIDVVEVVEDHFYRPIIRAALAVAGRIMRLQSGRLDAYLAYMLIALIAVLTVVTMVS